MSLKESLLKLSERFGRTNSAQRLAEAGKIIESEATLRLRGVGDPAPEITLVDRDGTRTPFTTLLTKGPICVTFLRGLWCPKCQFDLKELDSLKPDMEKAGATSIIVSYNINDANRRDFFADYPSLQLIEDHYGSIAQGFGIRWTADEARLIQDEVGSDLIPVRDSEPPILPLQARFLVGRDGRIAYANVANDFAARPDPDELRLALNALTRLRN